MKRFPILLGMLLTAAFGLAALCEAGPQSAGPGAVITVQPRDALDVTEEKVCFTLSAENAESYQWEYTSLPETAPEPYWIAASNNTSGITGGDTDTLTVTSSGYNSTRRYRCAVTGQDGETVYSDEVCFTIGSSLISRKTMVRAGVTAGICTLLAGLTDLVLRRRRSRTDPFDGGQ